MLMAVGLEQQRFPSLETLLSRHGLEEKDLRQRCTAKVRLEIAAILDDWKMVGYYLGFNSQKLNDIEIDNRTEDRRRVAFLDSWEQKEGERATFLELANAFHRRRRSDLVVKLCEIVTIKSDDIEDSFENVSITQKIQKLEGKIIVLNRQLRSELEKWKFTVDELLDELTLLPIGLRREYQDAIKKEIVSYGDVCRTVRQLFHLIINQLTTFLDYKLLEHLISKFGGSQLQRDMADYVDEVSDFKKETTVAELMDHWNGIEDQTKSVNYEELELRFGEDPTMCTLQRLDKHRKRFCSRYKLSELVMILIHLKPGSFIAVWRIPAMFVRNVTESAIQMDDLFFDVGKIRSLSVSGKYIFPLDSDETPSFEVVKELKQPNSIDEEKTKIYEYEYFCAHAASLTTGCSPEVVDRLAVGKCGDSRAPSVADSGIGSSDTYSLYSECSQLSKRSMYAPGGTLGSIDEREEMTLCLPASHRPGSVSPRSSPPEIPSQITPLVSSEELYKVSGRLRWKKGQRAPHNLFSSINAVATHDNVLYFNSGCNIFAYDANSSSASDSWSKLSNSPYSHCSLAFVNNLLTTIGGSTEQQITNKLFSLTGEGKVKSWTEKFPPMPTKRARTTSLCTGTSLIVVGGVTEKNVSLGAVEVMDTETHQWSTATDLPQPGTFSASTSSTLCDEHIFVEYNGRLYKCPLVDLLQSCKQSRRFSLTTLTSIRTSPTVKWSRVTDAPVLDTTCVSLNDKLLAVGGRDLLSRRTTTAVHMYDPATNSWTIISHMSISRSQCFAAVLADNQLVVVGGNWNSSVELATLI